MNTYSFKELTNEETMNYSGGEEKRADKLQEYLLSFYKWLLGED